MYTQLPHAVSYLLSGYKLWYAPVYVHIYIYTAVLALLCTGYWHAHALMHCI
jgi:hypothetical protein